MYLKIHKSGSEILVAVCDRNLLGKKLEHDNVNVEISEEFYRGDIASDEQVIEALTNAKSANLFGKKAVACAIKCGAVDPECAKTINGVPHAQIFRI
ncbi:MAG TPA: DUF424 family protein [Methanosarcinaceae archaeon]|nr:DUF424 family protein [Methanosarcinaceae archaeon]